VANATSRYRRMVLGEYRVVLRALRQERMVLREHRVVLRVLGRAGIKEGY